MATTKVGAEGADAGAVALQNRGSARRSSADRYTARSAILFIDADSRLQLLPEERE